MNIPVKISVQSDTASPALMFLLNNTDPHVLATKLAVPLARHWRDHLARLPRNRNGYPSTGFWEDAARRVVGLAQGGSVLLYSDKLGLRKRLYGGPVVAVNVKNLTIPICAEAYGTSVADWPELGHGSVIVILADGRKFFALWLGGDNAERFQKAFKGKIKRAEVTTRRARQFKAGSGEGNPKFIVFRGKGGAQTESRAAKHLNLKFLFRLIPETKPQTPMPQVIPSDLSEVAMTELRKAVKE